MYQRAKYYRDRFIRGGIVGIILLALMIYSLMAEKDHVNPMFYSLIVIPYLQLYYGLWIRKRLKTKTPTTDDVFEMSNSMISYKQIQYVLSFGFVIAFILYLKDSPYANYFGIPFFIIYFWWLIREMRSISRYLKEAPEERVDAP